MRNEYPVFKPIQTRWMDNDVYGHVNNVTYYSYFDTVINTYLVEAAGLDIQNGAVIGVCAESHCRFLDSLTFPQAIDAGLRVETLGRSSARYGIALFAQSADRPAALGWFVHVFVNRTSRRPTPIPEPLRTALERIRTATPASA